MGSAVRHCSPTLSGVSARARARMQGPVERLRRRRRTRPRREQGTAVAIWLQLHESGSSRWTVSRGIFAPKYRFCRRDASSLNFVANFAHFGHSGRNTNWADWKNLTVRAGAHFVAPPWWHQDFWRLAEESLPPMDHSPPSSPRALSHLHPANDGGPQAPSRPKSSDGPFDRQNPDPGQAYWTRSRMTSRR